MSAKFTPIAASAAARIAGYSPTAAKHLDIEIVQVEHRIQLINYWEIKRGSRVLEIGCGQGTCTTVIAEAVGPDGHVDAVDPGAPDYGSPFTLSQAQQHISASSEIGSRITWHNADPIDFLAQSANAGTRWDFVVFTHCIWYFDSQHVLAHMMAELKGRVTSSLLVAEYALKASHPDAQPHLLAAIARASLEAHNKASEANIRCMLSPTGIKEVAQENGWTLESETSLVPNESLLDGHWETSDVKSTRYLEDVDRYIQDARVQVMLKSARDAVIAAASTMDGKRTRTMDVWVGKFKF